jgi:hypothetical protein
MPQNSVQEDLENRATRAILGRAIYRWESAVIIGLTLILMFLVPRPFPFWQPWFWLGLGLLGEVALIWSSLKDPAFRARAVADMFHEEFDAREIRNEKLRGQVLQAQEYRNSIDAAIASSRESVLRDHLADVSQEITAWLENVFRLAQRLDAYLADKTIHRDMQSVTPAIETLKKRLAAEDDDEVKRQISQAIAQRQIQRDNLRQLQNVMDRAEIQLESTLTAMGTVYSQIMILSARDVASGRAQRLQQDITDQVQALQDVVQTLDEVYQAGVKAPGPGQGS